MIVAAPIVCGSPSVRVTATLRRELGLFGAGAPKSILRGLTASPPSRLQRSRSRTLQAPFMFQ